MLKRGRTLLHLVGCAVLLGVVMWPSAVGRAASPRAHPYTYASGAPSTTKKAIPGWPGAAAQYLGRYRLTKSSDPALATGGGLTIFLRKVPHFTKPLLSGILSLNAKHQANVVYLTKFMHVGTNLWTTVNLGIYTGPAFGQFKVLSLREGTLKAQLVHQGATPITLEFVRFAKNPHP